MKSYIYRNMIIEDYQEAYKLWLRVPGMGISGADSYANIETYLLRNPEQSFVCINSGQLVGTILCGNDGRRAYVYHLAVAPECHRKGVATELVRLAISKQAQLGIQKCHLAILTENKSGKAFWSEAGFHHRHDIDMMSKDIFGMESKVK